MHSLAWILCFSFGYVPPAMAACDGNACYKGVLRDCVRLPSGDGVWVNHTPYTRCEAALSQSHKNASPSIKYNYPPKRKPVEVPSPQLSPAERSAASASCVELQRKFWIKMHAAYCGCLAASPAETERRCELQVRVADEKKAIVARCPSLGEDWEIPAWWRTVTSNSERCAPM